MLDGPNLVLQALLAHLGAELSAPWRVQVGWIGNEDFPKDVEALLTMEAGRPRRDGETVEVGSWVAPGGGDDPVAMANVTMGRETLAITLVLWVHAEEGEGGKKKRAVFLRELERALCPLVPGRPQVWDTVLADDAQTRCRVEWLDAHENDSGGRIERNEWRADVTLEASYALREEIELPFCREIHLGEEGDSVAVDDWV